MDDLRWAIVFLLFSLAIWIYWGIGLFTDSALARLIRRMPSITKRRRDLSFFHPAMGTIALVVSITTFIEAVGGPAVLVESSAILSFFLVIAVVVIYWLPIRLPDWINPSWQEQRHAQRRNMHKTTSRPRVTPPPHSQTGQAESTDD